MSKGRKKKVKLRNRVLTIENKMTVTRGDIGDRN